MATTTSAPNDAPAQAGATPADKRRHRVLIFFNLLSLAIVIGTIAWAATIYFHLGSNIYTDDAQVEAYINPVNTRISGYLKEIRFMEHQHVRKGDTLILLDDHEYRVLAKQAEASVLDAEANHRLARADRNLQHNGIAVSQANMDEAKARLDNAEANLSRFRKLLEDDVVTRFQYDQYKSDRDALLARYLSLQHSSDNAKISTVASTERIGSAEASLARAKAALDYTRLNLSYTVILAPYDGVVGRKLIEEGQYVQPGQTLVSIVRDDQVWVTANYTESQIANLRIGEYFRISVDAVPHHTFIGRLYSISAATGSRYSLVPTDNSTGNFVKVQQRIPVKIVFTDKNSARSIALLKSGMNAEVELIKSSKQ